MKTGLLLSGGMDSIALAHWRRPDAAVTIDYGQVCAQAEIQAASQVALILDLHHEIIRVDCRGIGSGDLAGTKPNSHAASSEWWPYRNQLLITLAAMRLMAFDVQELMIANVVTDGNYRDGTREFIQLVNGLLSYQEGSMRVSAPAIELSTKELVIASEVPFEVLAWAHSCHKSNLACGDCRGCYKHQTAMEALGHGYF